MALSSFSKAACKTTEFRTGPVAFAGRETATHINERAWGLMAGKSPTRGPSIPRRTGGFKIAQLSVSCDRPNPNTLHQSEPSLRPIEINETCGDFDVREHLGLFFLLIDVDRTGSDRPFPTLCSGKHKYGFHA